MRNQNKFGRITYILYSTIRMHLASILTDLSVFLNFSLSSAGFVKTT